MFTFGPHHYIFTFVIVILLRILTLFLHNCLTVLLNTINEKYSAYVVLFVGFYLFCVYVWTFDTITGVNTVTVN